MKLESRRIPATQHSKGAMSLRPLSVALILAGLSGPAWALDYTWTSGNYTASFLPSPIGSTDTVLALSGAGKTLNIALINDGTFAQLDDSLTIGNTFQNNGTYQIGGDFRVSGSSAFTNDDTLVKTAGTGEARLSKALVNNSIIDAGGATIRYADSAKTFNAGTVFANGTHIVDVSSTYTAGFTLDNNLVFESGNQAVAPATGITLNSALQWHGGTMSGKWTNASGQTLTASSGASKTLNGAFVNDGTFAQLDDSLTIGNTFQNNGTYQIGGDFQVSGSSAFTNNGTLVKTAGTGEARLSKALATTSASYMDVQTGQLSVVHELTNNGVIRVAAGAVFNAESQNFTSAGTLTGDGAIKTAAGKDIENSGQINPGDVIGSLTLDGDVLLHGASAINFELADLASFDSVTVTGDISLDGTITLLNMGYTPMLGDSFVVMTVGGASTGSFHTLESSGFGQAFTFDVAYSAHDVTVTVTAVPEPPAYALLLSGLSLVGGLAARQRRSMSRSNNEESIRN